MHNRYIDPLTDLGIMEFQFNNINSNYLHNIALMNKDTGKVFYKSMGYKFLEAEQNKALTITFLNHVLKGKHEVVS